uniref:Uncharacterized protein n=1 Tax=Anguilla anguilla TaxID=7936 RepID=A0A0E9WV45_ANGAN
MFYSPDFGEFAKLQVLSFFALCHCIEYRLCLQRRALAFHKVSHYECAALN